MDSGKKQRFGDGGRVTLGPRVRRRRYTRTPITRHYYYYSCVILLCVHTAACGGVGQPISKRVICIETIVVNYFALFPKCVRVFPSFCFSVFAPRRVHVYAPLHACTYCTPRSNVMREGASVREREENGNKWPSTMFSRNDAGKLYFTPTRNVECNAFHKSRRLPGRSGLIARRTLLYAPAII